MSTLKLYLLGPPRVEIGGKPVKINRRKALALLVYLAVTNGPHPRSVLAGLLWGDMPEVTAMTNLRKGLVILRKLVGPHLNITREDVTFKRDSPYWLDVEQFEIKADDTSGRTDIDQLQNAVNLYQGDFLEGFYVRNAPEFEEWSLIQRTRLRELAVQALYRLAIHYTEQGESGRATAIDYTTRLLALEPWREEAHRQMMLLLALGGQRSAALTQYETCRRALEEELGVEPGEETTTLYERIRDGDLSRDEADISTLPPIPRHNLPAHLTPLIGRETELAEVAKLLAEPDQRLFTIVGPGGVGKTRLALDMATGQLDHFEHGVYFVPLASLTAADNIVGAVAQALDFSFYEASQPQEQLLNYLKEKQVLLVMDNFEHVLGGVALVTAILQTAPAVKIVATSRESLKLQEEQRFPLQGLAFPTGELEAEIHLEPNEAGQYAAVQLFLQQGHRIQPQIEWEATELAAVAGICRMLEGMPLGLILAATWTKILKPTEIIVELNQGLDFLAGDLRSLPTRQQSLRAVFDHSWRLLSEEERNVVQTLSVFRGGFTHQAAQAVTGTSLSILMELVDKSFLQRDQRGRRYEIHELLRQYAEEKLEGTGHSNEAHDAHSAYYIDFLHQRETKLKGAEQQAALAEIKADGENVRVAWNWAVEQGQIERLDRALEGLSRFYEWRGRHQDGEAACRLAIEKLSGTKSADRLRVLAKALAWQATFRRKSDYEFADQLLQRTLALLESPTLADQDTRSEQAFVLRQMGIIACMSDYKKAKQFYGQSLTLYQALGDQWGTANALDVLGWAFLHTGDFDRAKQFLKESLAIRRALGDPRAIANSLFALAYNAERQGQDEEAEYLVHEYLAILQKSSYRASLAQGFFNAGEILGGIGKFRESVTLLDKSFSIAKDLSLQELIAKSNLRQGFALIQLGQYEQARVQIELALTMFRESGDQILTGSALVYLAYILMAEETYAEAYDLLKESSSFRREIGHLPTLSYHLTLLGVAAHGLGNNPKAQKYLAEALQTATEIRFVYVPYHALPVIALLLIDREQIDRAVELYALASRYPFVANSRWFEDVAGQHIAAAATTLPPEVVAAAQERGKARDLWTTAEELLVEMKGWELLSH